MKLLSELTGLLKAVSRSFYLSLHFLPQEVRGHLSLGYLLARASDSIADSAAVPATERLALLVDFGHALQHSPSENWLSQVAALHVVHPGEQLLLKRLPECFSLLSSLEPRGKELIQKVMGHILHGQSLDLQRFPGAMPSAEALEEYTFLVAGSVGEFWSEILSWKIPQWASLPDEEMISLARNYGKGLQLVNILRDLKEDLAEGRSYLPGENDVLDKRSHWSMVAASWLQAGEKYVHHLRGWRLKFTADLPWRLGLATLHLLPEGECRKVKLPRSQVRWIMLQSAWLALWTPSNISGN